MATQFINTFNTNLEPEVQKHLKNVYSCVSMTLLSAGAGAYACLRIPFLQGSFLMSLAAMGFFLAIFVTQDEPKNQKKRLLYLLGGSACMGHSLGPLLSMAILVNPSILVTALLGTAFVFVSFTMAALLSPRGTFLVLGGILMSFVSVTFYLLLAIMLTGSTLLFHVYTYVGLAAACAFILYDTQRIIEKRRMGDRDYIKDALILFIDFVDLFRHLLIILMSKEKNDRRRRN